jgi:hypothetical protein
MIVAFQVHYRNFGKKSKVFCLLEKKSGLHYTYQMTKRREGKIFNMRELERL